MRLRDSAPELYRCFNSRTKANLIYCFIVDIAKVRFADVPGVAHSENRGFLALLFKSSQLPITIRFKKLSKYGKVSGIKTLQFQSYMAQQMSFDGFEQQPPANLICGYNLDKFQTDIASVSIICPLGDKVLWKLLLPSNSDQPIPIGIEPTTQEVPIMIAKGAKKAKKSETA